MAFKSVTFKLDDTLDSDILENLRNVENQSKTIREALRAYFNLPPAPPDETLNPAPFDPSALIDAFRVILPELGTAIGKSIMKEMRQTEPFISVNEQPEPEPILRAKRPSKNHQPEPEPTPKPEPEALEEATLNFMNQFG